jgi:hypothetical protein
MFVWPALELTEYEKKYVRTYKDGKFPGVLRRAYEVTFNTVADPLTPGLESIKLSGRIQIARRSRVFGLTFAGNLGSWRLQIETASGEQMTPKGISDGYPIVSSMISGSSWNALAAIGAQPAVTVGGVSSFIGSYQNGPMLIDPNWELSPNETLMFNGEAIDNQLVDVGQPAVGQKVLSIGVHVWEFPGMDGRSETAPGLGCK